MVKISKTRVTQNNDSHLYRWGMTNKTKSLHSNLLLNNTGDCSGCLLYTISVSGYAHLSRTQSFVHSPRKYPWGSIMGILSKFKCHLLYLKGSSHFELVMPYQSTVVFAVLVGQVSNGGCDAGTQELFSLV